MVKKEREIIGKCPACGGKIFEGEKSYYCENYKKEEEGGKGCKVFLIKLTMGKEFTKEEAEELFEKKKTEVAKGVTKEGKEVEFHMEYDVEEKVVKYKYEDSGEKKSLGKCPLCGKRIYEGKKNYYCEGYKDEPKCEFMLWKETEGAKFTAEMAVELLSGKKLDNVPCFNRDGDEYKSGFRLEGGDLIKIQYGGQRRGGNKNDA